MKKLTCLAVVTLLAGCAPDPLPGTYNFTISAGSDTTTAPSTSTSSPVGGTGTLAVTAAAPTQGQQAQGYILTLAHSDSTPCVLTGTASTQTPMSIAIKTPQTCTLRAGGTSVTATINSGTATLNASATPNTMALDVTYTYTGTTILGLTFSGNGLRTYTGPRM